MERSDTMTDGTDKVISHSVSQNRRLAAQGADFEPFNAEQPKKVVIIGLGGIGSWLTQTVAPILAFDSRIWGLTLCDGDKYTASNRTRQTFPLDYIGWNKADTQAIWVADRFPSLTVGSYPGYILDTDPGPLTDADYVLLAVDNHRTRKLVNTYCMAMKDVILISGGNEMTDGNVQIYIRKDGKDVTADIAAYHSEIADPTDKAPFEKSCEELAVSEPQILATNLMAASLMLNTFWGLAMSDWKEQPSALTRGEVYFHILSNSTIALARKPR